jgi:hypothetical protein
MHLEPKWCTDEPWNNTNSQNLMDALDLGRVTTFLHIIYFVAPCLTYFKVTKMWEP